MTLFLKVPANRLYGRRLINLKEVVEFIDAKVMLLHAHKAVLKQFTHIDK
jgi:hypothetical protein